MSFWNRIKSIGVRSFDSLVKRTVGVAYTGFKRVIGVGRFILDTVDKLKNVPILSEVASAVAEANPEISITLAGGFAGLSSGILAGEKAISLIDRAVDSINSI